MLKRILTAAFFSAIALVGTAAYGFATAKTAPCACVAPCACCGCCVTGVCECTSCACACCAK